MKGETIKASQLALQIKAYALPLFFMHTYFLSLCVMSSPSRWVKEEQFSYLLGPFALGLFIPPLDPPSKNWKKIPVRWVIYMGREDPGEVNFEKFFKVLEEVNTRWV